MGMVKKYAIVFPGQGSQSIGMLKELALSWPKTKDLFAQASQVLGYDLWELTQQGPEETLNKTQYTQPALLAADIAVWEYWKDHAKTAPQFMAGHSLGEYSALVAAEALRFEDALRLVALRGRYMQEAVPAGVGAMAAIVGLDDSALIQVCKEASQGEVVSPANFNSIGQTVIAGHTGAVTRAIDLAKLRGAKLAKVLPVSVPSHCILMKPAAEQLAIQLKNTAFSHPKVPVVHNCDVMTHRDAEAIRAALIQQLTEPVRWVATMQGFIAQGIRDFLECGPGRVLAGLNKRIDAEITSHAINEEELLKNALKIIEGESDEA